MQLAAAGARVVAVDRSVQRLARLRDNLLRVGLNGDLVAANVLEWDGGAFDAVLLDAPCSGTGTIRRHPDIPWIKRESDIAGLAALQRRLIGKAVDLVKPGGALIYCVCSLEPEEGIDVVEDALRNEPKLRRRPILPGEIHIASDWLTPHGDLRTLPCHLPDPDAAMAGLDGFYAARLERA
jgi:16S rRNA (cytosine967-C5)-methyltransferase